MLSHALAQAICSPIAGARDGAGEQMPQSARIAPLLDGGAVVGTITVIEDVTERVTSERELRPDRGGGAGARAWPRRRRA